MCLPLYFHRPPPPPLAEIYKEQKIRRGREGGWYTPRLKSRGEPRERGVICTRDFPPLSPPKGGGKVAILETKRNELLRAWKRLQLWILYIFLFRKNMAENVLDSGPPSAKRPKLSSPALSASASDGNGKYCFNDIICYGVIRWVCYFSAASVHSREGKDAGLPLLFLS